MKKLFLLLFSAVSLSVAVHAQDSSTARHQHDRSTAIKQQRTDSLMQQLNLTDEQKTKLQQLRDEQKSKMDSIRNSNLSESEKTTQMRAIRESGRKNMESVLTHEQMNKWQQLRSTQAGKGKSQKQGADSTE